MSSGSFGRSARTLLIDAAAILAVPRTILGAAKFENLTAVYFYSVAISSFPIFIVALIRMMAAHPGFARATRVLLFWLPFEQKPLRAVAVIFAIFVGCFSGVATLLLTPVSS